MAEPKQNPHTEPYALDTKPELRKRLRARRRSLSRAHQTGAARNLLAQLKSLPVFRNARKIAMYLANDGEIDPVRVMAWCWRNGIQCYVPVVIPGGRNTLVFAEATEHTTFVENRFGIQEPVVRGHNLIDPQQLDLVLLPLVAFDTNGNRVGMGGGFYDATFGSVRETGGDRPRLIGIAHDIQRVGRIDAEPWDIPLSAVVTDAAVYPRIPGSRGPSGNHG